MTPSACAKARLRWAPGADCCAALISGPGIEIEIEKEAKPGPCYLHTGLLKAVWLWWLGAAIPAASTQDGVGAVSGLVGKVWGQVPWHAHRSWELVRANLEWGRQQQRLHECGASVRADASCTYDGRLLRQGCTAKVKRQHPRLAVMCSFGCGVGQATLSVGHQPSAVLRLHVQDC